MPYVYCSFVNNIQWKKPPENYIIDSNIHTWRLQLSANIHNIKDAQLSLQASELVRAEQYALEKDRQRFIISRAMLRRLLALYADMDEKEITFFRSNNNKPYMQVSGRELHFNIAHSEDWVVIAVSGRPVGIDLERSDPSFTYQHILADYFSPGEIEFIKSNPQERKWFYTCWTRKESLVKATGGQIDETIIFIPCMDGQHPLQETTASGQNWNILSFDMGSDYLCSVACNTDSTKHAYYECCL